jgi:hypothetical protein
MERPAGAMPGPADRDSRQRQTGGGDAAASNSGKRDVRTKPVHTAQPASTLAWLRVKSDLRDHRTIVRPRSYDGAMVTQITLI